MVGDLITVDYAKTLVDADPDDVSQDGRLAALVRACSSAASSWCGRRFFPGYFSEFYAGSGAGFLVLKTSPIIRLDSVIIGPSTDSPQTYTTDDFDVEPLISRLTFKPATVAESFYVYTSRLAFPSGVNTIQASYYGGYGDLVTSAAAISTGSQTVTPTAMYGITANGDEWSLSTSQTVLVDAGLPTQELVTPTAVASGTFTATFTRPHAAGCSMLLPVIPQDVQMGVGLMVGNLYNQTDFTKQSEKLDQYAYTLRGNQYGAAFTPEVISVLGRYKSLFAG